MGERTTVTSPWTPEEFAAKRLADFKDSILVKQVELSEHEALETFRRHVADAGGGSAFANKHGVSKAYVSDLCLGRRALSDRMAALVGLTRKVVYSVTYVQEAQLDVK